MAGNDIGPRIGIDGEKQFHDSLSAINAQMRALGNEMKAVTAEFSENAKSEEALAARTDVLTRSVDAAKSKLSILDGQLDRQRGRLSELAQELERAAAEYGETSQEAAAAQNAYNRQYRTVADLEGQYQRTRRQLAEFEQQMRDAGDTAEEANDQLGGAGVLAGQAAWDGIKTAVSAVASELQKAISVGMQFDAAVSDIAATMGTTVSSIGNLRGFAQEMGATTVFTATQAAQALNYMALAGYDAETAMSTLPNVLNLAAAGGVELATASDMVTDAQSALGLSLEQTGVLVDEMAKASTKTNTSVAQLGEAILTVGGTAKFLAGGTAELNQVLGLLADNSIKGAEGGTKLRNIILSLSAPTDKAAKTLDNLGVSVFDAQGSMRQFSEVFPELKEALSGLTSEEQITALSEIFNSRDIAAAQALLGTTVERWDALAASIDNAQGSAERMAETRLDNLAGDITLLESAADGARIALSDSLTPALRDAAQTGAGLLTFVGGAVEEIPFLGQALAGLTAGLGVLAAGMAASAAATTGLTGALAAAGAAAMASPWGLAALAVGGLVAAVTALSHAADHAEDKLTDMGRAVAESRAAWEEQKESITGQLDNIEDLAAQLDSLASRENRTAGEKERLLAVTNALNEAVPGLGLEYDKLSDSLNMTTDQILALARAQAQMEERQAAAAAIVDAEQQHAQVQRELEQAYLDLAAARSALSDAEMAGMGADMGCIEAMDGLRSAVKSTEARVKELEQAETDSAAQVEEMTVHLEELADSTEEAAEALEDTAAAAEESGAQYEALAAAAAEAKDVVLDLSGAAGTLSDALKEQEKSGSLSLKTTQELIEAGYGAALAIDTESGTVTLNRDLYVQLAQAKIDEQIATLEAARAAAQAQIALQDEAMAAYRGAEAYFKAAEAKKAFEGEVISYEAQIAALRAARNGLNSYGSAVTSAARKSAGASKKIKTQAEKDLEEFKALKAELDHQQAMGLIQDQEYYRRLAGLRDQYLTDSANIDQYRKVSETIYKADEKALQEREKLWQTAGDNIVKLEEKFQKELSDRAQEIVNSYKLFDEVPEYQKASGQELISNLENQIGAIQSFYDNVAALEERGVDAALADDIRKMGVKASGELAGLLALTDEQLTRYSELYGEKQALANDIATKELGELRLQTNEEIIGQLDDVAQLYDTNAPALGMAFAEKLAAGMFEGMPAVEAMAQTVARAAMSSFEQSFNRDVEAMMTASGSRVSAGDIGELMAGFANSMMGADTAAAPQPMHITIQTEDKLTIARAFVPDIRKADRENPDKLGD